MIDSISLSNNLERINTDKFMLLSLCGLITVLPIAHTNFFRSVFLISIIGSWLFKMYTARKPLICITNLELPLFIYFITIVISFFSSLKLSTSINELRGEFIIPITTFYAVATNFKDEKKLKNLFWVICFVSLAMSLIGIVEFLIKKGSFTNYDIRPNSLHQGYEAFAQYLIIVLPYIIMGMLYAKNNRHKILLTGIFLIHTFALYVTHTRGAWVGFFMEIFMLLFLICETLTKKLALFTGFFILCLITITILPEKVIWHGGNTGISLDEKDFDQKNTTSNRLIMWKASIEELTKYPFRGAGYGKANFKRRFTNRNFAKLEQAHNSFVNIAIQLGIQGLLALLFLIYSLLKITRRKYKTSTTSIEKIFIGGTWVMIWGFFTGNMFAEFFIDDTALFFWILCGLSIALISTPENSTLLFSGEIKKDKII